MRNIHEIARGNKINLIGISILVRLYKDYPNMMLVQNLIDDESFFDIVITAFDALVKKGIVIVGGTGIVWGNTNLLNK